MADIVAFEFEARTAALAQLPKDAFDVREGVAEYQIACRLQMLLLPLDTSIR